MPHIDIRNVSLEYPVYTTENTSIKKHLINLTIGGLISKKSHKATIIKALENINLRVNKGDRVGILGHNGAGKTTLLRCISGIYKPTFGEIIRSGSLVPLIEISAGLEPELSGIENIQRLLHLRGIKNINMKRFNSEIAEFSELGDFLYLPVRTYSSGMIMRLMFSVATANSTEILVLDEFFCVGDEGFQRKAEKRLTQQIKNTPILIFSSHNKEIIKKLCNRFIILTKGKIHETML